MADMLVVGKSTERARKAVSEVLEVSKKMISGFSEKLETVVTIGGAVAAAGTSVTKTVSMGYFLKSVIAALERLAGFASGYIKMLEEIEKHSSLHLACARHSGVGGSLRLVQTYVWRPIR